MSEPGSTLSGEGAPAGRLEAIWVKRGKRAPMDPAERAELVAGRGLVGNANQGGKRQVTVIEREAWDAIEAELGVSVPKTARRANLLLSGVPLAGVRSRVLRVGPCRIRILSETRPCERMNEAHPDLRAVMGKDWRGGSYGEVLDGGPIAVGDPVAWEA